jgi:hypothetical protein
MALSAGNFTCFAGVKIITLAEGEITELHASRFRLLMALRGGTEKICRRRNCRSADVS